MNPAETAANDITLPCDVQENRITEVVLFTDRAYVKRRAKACAENGLNRFLIEIQALKPDPDSVQARVFGHGELLSAQYRQVPVPRAPQPEIRRLEEEKKQLLRRKKALADEKEVIHKQRCFLDAFIDFADTEIPKAVKTRLPEKETMAAMLAFLADRFGHLAANEQDLDSRMEDLNEELRLVERKLKQLKRSDHHERKTVEIWFQAEKAHNIEIEVAYLAAGASWEPVYKVDIQADEEDIGLAVFARMEQKTGEHWHDVDLTVSNTAPLQTSALPELSTWHLDQPVLYKAAGGAVAMAAAGAPPSSDLGVAEEALEDFELGESLEDLPEAAVQTAVMERLPQAFEYRLARRVDLGSGGGDAFVPLTTQQVRGEFIHHAVPAKDPRVYLVAEAQSDQALLAGRLNVYFDGRFIGGSPLSETPAGRPLTFNLGPVRDVKILREKATDKRSETFFGRVDRSHVAREMAYRVVAENLKSEPVRLRLLDAVPVAATDRLQVKGVELSPKPDERSYRRQEGVACWHLKLPPGEKTEISIRFYVKYPRNMGPLRL